MGHLPVLPVFLVFLVGAVGGYVGMLLATRRSPQPRANAAPSGDPIQVPPGASVAILICRHVDPDRIATLLRAYGSHPITLLGVPTSTATATRPGERAAPSSQRSQDGQPSLERLARAADPSQVFRVRTKVLAGTGTAEELLTWIRKEHPALVLVPTCEGAPDNLGRTALALLEHSPAPVAVWREP